MGEWIPTILGVCVFSVWIGARAAMATLKASRARREEDRKIDHSLIQSQRDVLALLAQALSSTSDLPAVAVELKGLATGMEAMCKATAERTDALNKAVEILQASISPTPGVNGYEDYAEDTPGAMRRAEEMELDDLVRRGIPANEASKRIRERNIYEGLGR